MANSTSHNAIPPIKNARYTINPQFITSAGAATDPTSPDSEFSTDGGVTFTDCAEEVTTGGARGGGFITLSGAEMNANSVQIYIGSSNCQTVKIIVLPLILPLVSSGTLSAGSAGGGTLGTILPYDVTGCIVMSTGGTGGGGTGGANNQARRVATYNTSTGAFTVIPNWETTPDATTTYNLHLPEGMTLGALRALNPATAGRTVVVDTAGLVDANTVKVGPTGSGTAQTARDIGLSVLLSNGTSTGQIVLNSGVADARLADAVSHGGTLGSSTATFAISRLNITSQTSNTAGVTIAGNGSGAGMSTTGGLTGTGLSIVGGGTSGDGLSITTSGGHGINVAPAGTSKHAILLTGSSGGTGDALKLVAGTGGVGFRGDTLNFSGTWIVSGAVTLNALTIASNFTVSGTTGLQAVTMTTLNTSGAATLNSLVVSTTAAFTGNVALAAGLNITQSSSNTSAVVITGAGTGDGITVTSGGGISGSAIALVANSTNGSALRLAGKGTGAGLIATGGLTGNGILLVGGGTSGDAMKLTTTSGHGINSAPVGIGKHGIFATGGNGGTSDGASFVAGTGGVGLRAGTMTVDGAVVFGSTFAIGSTFSMVNMSISNALVITNPGGDSPVTITSSDGSAAISLVGTLGLNILGATNFTGAVTASNAGNDIRLGATSIGQIQSGLSTLTAAGVRTAVGLASANLDTQLAAIQADTDNIQTRIPAALVSGRMDSSVGAMAANVLTASALATDAVTEIVTAVGTDLSGTHGSGSWEAAGSGSGAFVVTVTVKDGSAVALQNVLVRLKEGINSFTATTNASGIATFGLDAATYTRSMTKAGYEFAPDSIIVTAAANFDATMTAMAIAEPSDPLLCRVYGYFINTQGNAAIGETLTITLIPAGGANLPLTASGNVISFSSCSFKTDASGFASVDVLRTDAFDDSGCTYNISMAGGEIVETGIVLTSSTKDISTL